MLKTFIFGVLVMFLLGACAAGPASNQQATNATGGPSEITVYRSPT